MDGHIGRGGEAGGSGSAAVMSFPFTIFSRFVAKAPIMGAIGSIWAWLMLLGGVRAHLTHALPHDLIWAMILSGAIALPLLWNRNNGVLAAVAPSGIVRAGLAVLIVVAAGVAHPQAILGLVTA